MDLIIVLTNWQLMIFFFIFASNIDCVCSSELPQCGNSNKYPQSRFLSQNKKNNVFPCRSHFFSLSYVGISRVLIIRTCLSDVLHICVKFFCYALLTVSKFLHRMQFLHSTKRSIKYYLTKCLNIQQIYSLLSAVSP